MPRVKPVFLDFVRQVVKGEVDEVSRRLATSPSLATVSSDVGATRGGASNFFFSEIAHYLYAGDTALHMAAAAFRRPVAELLVAHGADCRARNRRGAEPLHYAADANRWTRRPRPRRSDTSCRPARIPTPWITPAWRLCTGLCEHGRCPRSGRCWMVVRTRGHRIRPGRRPCTSPFRQLGEEGAVLSTHASSRRASSGCCWNAAQARPTKMGEVDKCVRRRRVIGFEPCSS